VVESGAGAGSGGREGGGGVGLGRGGGGRTGQGGGERAVTAHSAQGTPERGPMAPQGMAPRAGRLRSQDMDSDWQKLSVHGRSARSMGLTWQLLVGAGTHDPPALTGFGQGRLSGVGTGTCPPGPAGACSGRPSSDAGEGPLGLGMRGSGARTWAARTGGGGGVAAGGTKGERWKQPGGHGCRQPWEELKHGRPGGRGRSRGGAGGGGACGCFSRTLPLPPVWQGSRRTGSTCGAGVPGVSFSTAGVPPACVRWPPRRCPPRTLRTPPPPFLLPPTTPPPTAASSNTRSPLKSPRQEQPLCTHRAPHPHPTFPPQPLPSNPVAPQPDPQQRLPHCHLPHSAAPSATSPHGLSSAATSPSSAAGTPSPSPSPTGELGGWGPASGSSRGSGTKNTTANDWQAGLPGGEVGGERGGPVSAKDGLRVGKGPGLEAGSAEGAGKGRARAGRQRGKRPRRERGKQRATKGQERRRLLPCWGLQGEQAALGDTCPPRPTLQPGDCLPAWGLSKKERAPSLKGPPQSRTCS